MTAARLASFVVWAAVAASALAWGLRWTARPLPLAESMPLAGNALPQGLGDLTRLFGAPIVAPAPQAPPADARFKLIGVVAPREGSHASGLALIAVDGKPPRAVATGALLDADTRVLSVSHRRVELGPRGGPASAVLELPPLPEAARGTPSPLVGIATPAVSPMPVMPVTPPVLQPQPSRPSLQMPAPQPASPAPPFGRRPPQMQDPAPTQ
ncbi:MAG: hypothetical protein HY021_07465 [Burkholderiales bacterium]|nr:hypothetical protein [Burkholderiales bacterium]